MVATQKLCSWIKGVKGYIARASGGTQGNTWSLGSKSLTSAQEEGSLVNKPQQCTRTRTRPSGSALSSLRPVQGVTAGAGRTLINRKRRKIGNGEDPGAPNRASNVTVKICATRVAQRVCHCYFDPITVRMFAAIGFRCFEKYEYKRGGGRWGDHAAGMAESACSLHGRSSCYQPIAD